jgi:integrase
LGTVHRESLSVADFAHVPAGDSHGKAKENPARATGHHREDNSRVRYLGVEEEKQLRKGIPGEWAQHMLELDRALHTVMRLGEIYGFTWGSVNLPQRVLTIPRSNNGERRYIRVNSVAIAALLTLRDRENGSGAVIRNLRGEPLCGPRYWFEKALETAKIEASTGTICGTRSPAAL